jgi:hypothetical protein
VHPAGGTHFPLAANHAFKPAFRAEALNQGVRHRSCSGGSRASRSQEKTIRVVNACGTEVRVSVTESYRHTDR